MCRAGITKTDTGKAHGRERKRTEAIRRKAFRSGGALFLTRKSERAPNRPGQGAYGAERHVRTSCPTAWDAAGGARAATRNVRGRQRVGQGSTSSKHERGGSASKSDRKVLEVMRRHGSAEAGGGE